MNTVEFKDYIEARGLFDDSPAPLLYVSCRDKYPRTTKEAWTREWNRIGEYFRRAVTRYVEAHA